MTFSFISIVFATALGSTVQQGLVNLAEYKFFFLRTLSLFSFEMILTAPGEFMFICIFQNVKCFLYEENTTDLLFLLFKYFYEISNFLLGIRVHDYFLKSQIVMVGEG